MLLGAYPDLLFSEDRDYSIVFLLRASPLILFSDAIDNP